MKTNNPYRYRKIVRYTTGEMTNLERVWFEWVIAGSKEMKRLVEEMRKDWNIAGKHLDSKSVNPDKAWSSLYQRLESEQLLSGANGVSASFNPMGYLKYAAIIIFALVISGVAGYKYYNPSLVFLANNTSQNTLITTLPDGTSIYLAQNSTLTYPKRFVGKTRAVELDGEAFFEVAKNPERPFIINTKAASVKVLGTSFNLKSTNSDNFELNVVEGKVGVNLNANPLESLIAIAGDRILSENEKLIKERVTRITTAKNTMVRLQFQHESFEDIINVINKTYSSNLRIYGDKLKERRISVTFENDISSIVNILSVSFNLEISHRPDNTITLKEKHE